MSKTLAIIMLLIFLITGVFIGIGIKTIMLEREVVDKKNSLIR